MAENDKIVIGTVDRSTDFVLRPMNIYDVQGIQYRIDHDGISIVFGKGSKHCPINIIFNN